MSDDGGGSPVTVIRVARWRTGGAIASAAVGLCLLVGLYAWLWVFLGHGTAIGGFREDPLESVLTFAPLLIIAFQLGACICGALRGDRLTLDPAGFHYRYYRQVGFVRWQDVEQFRTEAPMPGLPEVVGWDYRSDCAGNPIGWKRLRSTGRYPTSLHGDLGHRWQGGSRAVCEALERWRARYAVEAPGDPVVRQPALADGDAVLIVHASAWKTLLSLIVLGAGIVFALGLSVWLAAISRPVLLSDWFVVLVPCLGLVIVAPLFWIYLRRLIARPRITLTSAGFEVADEKGRLFTAWHEVAVFGLIHHAQSHGATVGWRLKNKPDADPYSAEMHQAVGGGFQGSPDALRDTLDDWRIRYSQGVDPDRS